MNLPSVSYSLIYNAKDITRDISDQVISITYTDKTGGESDTLEITLEDKLLRWQNNWYPEKGDSMRLIIRQGSAQLDCGTFEVDELEINCSTAGDIFSIKGLAAGIKRKMRTKNSYAHEDKTLREIAATVAGKLGLTVIGTVPDIALGRSNQYRETDLAYLNRIGDDYGCVFSVRADKMTFTYYRDLEKRSASLTLTKQELISASIRDQTHKTFKKCRVKHHDPVSKEVIDFAAEYDEDGEDEEIGGNDDLEIRSRVENKQQAEAKAKHALFKKNTQGVGGDITLPGNILFISGNNTQLIGLGRFSGIFHILESTHNISQSGAYQTSGNVKRVKTVDHSLFKTT